MKEKELFIAILDGASEPDIRQTKLELKKRSLGWIEGKEIKNSNTSKINPNYSKEIFSKTGNIEENFSILHTRDFDCTNSNAGRKKSGMTTISIQGDECNETNTYNSDED